MAKILTAIPISSFEIIRTRIAEILALELANQKTLQPTLDLSATIFEERATAIDTSEGTVISVLLNSNSEQAKSQVHTSGQYSYYIDVYTEASSTPTERGDSLARILCQRFIGLIRGILENPVYKFLDFEVAFIQRVQISNTEMASPLEDASSSNTAFGRVTMQVSSMDANIPQYARDLESSQFTFKIGDSGKGHVTKYEYTI